MPVWECYRTNACLCLLCSKMDHLMVTTDKYFNCGFAKEYLQSRSQGLLKNIELARQYLTVLKIHFNNSEIILFAFDISGTSTCCCCTAGKDSGLRRSQKGRRHRSWNGNSMRSGELRLVQTTGILLRPSTNPLCCN